MNPQQNKPSILELIAREIVALSRHGSILVFANSRRVVEALADVLEIAVRGLEKGKGVADIAEGGVGAQDLGVKRHGNGQARGIVGRRDDFGAGT